jgi:hypothetical protein
MTDVILVIAGEFDEALKDAYPRRKRKHKPTPVTLEYNETVSELTVTEAKHGKFQNALGASGHWTQNVQVDGVALARIIMKYPPDTELELHAEPDSLMISFDKSKVRLNRIDGKERKGIRRSPEKPDPKHNGLPEGIDDALQPDSPQKRTWGFSAHMAMMKKKKK